MKIFLLESSVMNGAVTISSHHSYVVTESDDVTSNIIEDWADSVSSDNVINHAAEIQGEINITIYHDNGSAARHDISGAISQFAWDKILSARIKQQKTAPSTDDDHAPTSKTAESKRPFHPGRKYRHYKGGIYELIGIATHSETDERMVEYRSIDTGRKWVRPASMWHDDVNGTPRFQLMEDDRDVLLDAYRRLAAFGGATNGYNGSGKIIAVKALESLGESAHWDRCWKDHEEQLMRLGGSQRPSTDNPIVSGYQDRT